MTEEINSQDKKRVLEHFKTKGMEVHIKIIDGDDNGLFRNGLILAISNNHFLILDDVIGSCNYLYTEISDKITKFRVKEEFI